jgi:hypothetical protein
LGSDWFSLAVKPQKTEIESEDVQIEILNALYKIEHHTEKTLIQISAIKWCVVIITLMFIHLRVFGF